MLFYITTKMPLNVISSTLKYYIDYYSSFFTSNNALSLYLKSNYNMSLHEVFNHLKNDVKISDMKDYTYQIYYDNNTSINNNQFKNILQLIEYGNLEIKAPKLLSIIMNEAIERTKDEFGGE